MDSLCSCITQTCGAHDGARTSRLTCPYHHSPLSLLLACFSLCARGCSPLVLGGHCDACEGMALPLARGYALEHTTDWDAGK